MCSSFTRLLTKYQLSLIDVFGGFDEVPVHITIIISGYDDSSKYLSDKYFTEDVTSTDFNQDILERISDDRTVIDFIGNLRSKYSRSYEDILIGTNGSIIMSKQSDILLPYHSFTRALHLFLTKFNKIAESICKEVTKW